MTKRGSGTLCAASFPSLRQILERLEIVDNVSHRRANALAATNRGKIGDFFSVHNRKSQKSVADPSLLDFDVMGHVFDEFVNGWFILPARGQARCVQEIDDRPLLENRGVGDRFLQRDQALSQPAAT